MTQSTGPWDDPRLGAAFAARAGAAPPTPPDLVPAVRARIAGAPRVRSGPLGWRLAPAIGLAAAIGLAVVVGVGQLGQFGPVASSRPSPPDATAIVESPLTPTQAIAIRDAGVDDREIAVTGFLGVPSVPPSCPFTLGPRNPARLDCGGSMWLMENQESIETVTGGTITTHGPRGPAIQPSFQLVSLPLLGVGASIPPASPILTLIGHFDDRRAALCEPEAVPDCRNTFVVDRIAAVGATDQPVTTLLANTRWDDATSSDVALPWTTAEANLDRAIAAAVPDVAIVSRQLLTGDRVGGAEPALRNDAAWIGQRLVWIVTGVGSREGRPVARTFLLPDGATGLVEMTAAGPVRVAPNTALDLDILSVAEAIAIRDGDPGGREIAVRGWFSAEPAVTCLAEKNVAENPVRLECPKDYQWLLDTPEPLRDAQSTLPPGRVGFQPLLPFLDLTALMQASQPAAAGSLPEVVLIGHFHDRRGHGNLCDVPDPAACAGFVADGIFSIDGVRTATSTIVDMEPWAPELRHEPTWTAADVDHLFRSAIPSLQILSRVALPGHRIGSIEPALGTDGLGIMDRDVAWIVTGLDVGAAGQPVRRTFLVVDGTAEAYESAPMDISPVGFVPFPLIGLPLESPVPAWLEPSDDPFADAPTSVFGIGVRSVSTAKELHPQHDSAEVAIRGWYVPPDPAASCPGLRDPIRPVDVPCNMGRHWLLDQPQQLWSDPLKVDIDRQPIGAYLNPIMPFDVSFDVPSGWADGTPEPWPVILLGHFADPRTVTGSGRLEFTVDALAWQRGDPPGAGDRVQNTVSFQRATESEDLVRRRLDDRLGPAYATWLTVMSGAELQIIDEDVEAGRSDLAEAPAVWVARRLIDERDGPVVRRVVTTAMTVDGSDRIWERADCCTFRLVTLLTVPRGPSDPHLSVEDHLGQVTAASFDAPRLLTWRPIGPPESSAKAIAATNDPR